MKITLADYGVGNIHSITKALEMAGFQVDTVTDMSKLLDAKCIMFPGVGAFDSTMERLLPVREQVRERLEAGVPTLSICIGAQIMFSASDEGKGPGIGVYEGRVRKLGSKTVPHMGWNTLNTEDPILEDIGSRHFYFAHSYYCDAVPDIVKGTTEYEGFIFPTLMRKYNIVSTQFHPEKSSVSGQKFLKNFYAYAEENA
ncbi:imidazole glycerol phosphate synthase, glutamine amidotransferase subunit [Thermoplasmatales archaeon BRNA1]|nr:imidazole glycerol phosphate synthase, glutamine amidotransferase subunit [Thermoplasmatales archaeon BRNA1]